MAKRRPNRKLKDDTTDTDEPISRDPKSTSKMSVCVIFVMSLLITMLIFKLLPLKNFIQRDNGGWTEDSEMVSIAGDFCDFEQISASELSQARFDKEFRNKKPVLIHGLIDDWPANKNWRRSNLEQRSGNSGISSGDGANIVMSGGWSGHSAQTLAEYLQVMANTSASFISGEAEMGYDMFNFDADFISAMPDLKPDFNIPSLFHKWAGKGKRGVSEESHNPAWSILSLGATRTGLPFHIHGETWLGIVYGHKRWFVYPPGMNAPLSILKETMFLKPLMSSYEWFIKVRPKLLHLGTTDYKVGTRPLECTQSGGDVMYLPPGWNHLTLNLGETIGVGGQTVYNEQERLEQSMANLKQTPHDILSLKSAALSFAQMAMHSQQSAELLKDAQGMLDMAVKLSPAHPETCSLHAELLHMGGRSSEAREVLKKCASQYNKAANEEGPSQAAQGLSESKLASVRVNFGRAFMAIEDPVGALEQLKMAIKLQPDLPDAYHISGAALKMQGRNREASIEIAKGNRLTTSKPKSKR